MGYVAVIVTVLFTALGQMLIKAQVDKTMSMRSPDAALLETLIKIMLNPWVIVGFVAAGCAAIGWIYAMMKLPFNIAYPILIGLLSTLPLIGALVLGEMLTVAKIGAMVMIFGGIILLALQQ